MRALSFADLRAKGVLFTRQHLHRLIRQGRFPRPFKMAPGGSANAWCEDEIDKYIEDRIAERGMAFVSRPPAEGRANTQQKRAAGQRDAAAKNPAAA
jgi:prophage regulatory protein